MIRQSKPALPWEQSAILRTTVARRAALRLSMKKLANMIIPSRRTTPSLSSSSSTTCDAFHESVSISLVNIVRRRGGCQESP